ncbi:hypothetical protein FHU30_007565 [Actinomadura rupiterrae]|nr:hypothetical protein [Actinomadura rupiterrae]MCP2342173.1 hypothetical protein [Actinomadura rupiterrae]
MHPDPHECADALVTYSERFDEYGLIIHDGGSAVSSISFCPWCGTKLPQSWRDVWFDEIEALGIDPWEDQVPSDFETGAWRAGRAHPGRDGAVT